MYVEPHPYLTYVYKRYFVTQKAMPVFYPLHKNKGYRFSESRTNNLRLINGPDGNRDITVPKPKNLIRINCLGASTTANQISYQNQNYSYPMELEKILKSTFPEFNLEVNNCAQGGYTSAEILIKFLLDTFDTEPDIIVIYHAYNDLAPSLTAGFQRDYSHAKRNLGEVYHLYRAASRIPSFPLATWNYMVNNYFFSQNLRFSLLDAISRGCADIKNDFRGLDAYRRNLEHLINVSKGNHMHVILSTFCHYLYPAIKDDKTHLKYHEGVRLENEVMRKISLKHKLPLIENDLLIPQEDKYFLDSMHFTPEGMQLLARNISVPIIEYIKNQAFPI